ncbi:MAG: beta-galactosidase trimerization domain-containing protein [Kiritimatiellae bacterium]|nr:beta-galactosidase trimerization domain-containing protein [Kiritimatiellia bacterium]
MRNMINEAGLAPNGFPRPPEWAWSIRMAVFPGKGCDGGARELLDLTDAEIETACARYAARGVSLIQAAGFHPRMMWIPELERITDLNRRITVAAHRHGMRVVDHHTCNGMWQRVSDRLYGWCPDEASCVDIRFGRRYVPDGVKFCCLNHPDFRRHYYRYITDYVARTGVDAMMCDDMLFFYGQYGCGCDHCRARFLRVLGYEMPRTGNWPLDDYSNPVWRDWMRFRTGSIMEFKHELRKRLPDEFVLFTDSNGCLLDLDDCHHAGQNIEALAQAGDGCQICESGGVACREKPLKPLVYSNYQNWEQMCVTRKYMQAVSRHWQTPSIQHQYPATPAEGWFCWALNKFAGLQHWRDDAWQYGGARYADEFEKWTPATDYLNWEARHEGLWRYSRGAADVGLLFSARTKLNLGADPQPHAEEYCGWAQTLLANGIFFDAVIDPDLEDIAALRRFKVVILPNAVCLSEQQMATLKTFVEAGGNLIATHQTSLADETGAARADFGLADLLGVHVGDKPPTLRSAWLLDQRARESGFGRGLPPRLPFQPVPVIRWDGENESRIALAWAERVRVSFGWPTMPATVESRHKAGRVLYHLPPAGQLAYREGPYPLWCRAPEHDEVVLREEAEGVRFEVKRHLTPEQARFVYVDEGHDGYRQLIVNSVRRLLPEPRAAVAGLPAGVLCDIHRLGRSPADNDFAAGDLVVSLLNVSGMLFKPGETVPHAVPPEYPPLAGVATLILRDTRCRAVHLYSPDHPEPLALPFVAGENCVRVEIPLQEVKRLAFVRIDRGA